MSHVFTEIQRHAGGAEFVHALHPATGKLILPPHNNDCDYGPLLFISRPGSSTYSRKLMLSLQH